MDLGRKNIDGEIKSNFLTEGCSVFCLESWFTPSQAFPVWWNHRFSCYKLINHTCLHLKTDIQVQHTAVKKSITWPQQDSALVLLMPLWHLLAKANANHMLEWLKDSALALANVLTLQSRYNLHLILSQKQFLAAILSRRMPKMSGNWISRCLQAAGWSQPWGAMLGVTMGDIYSTVINLISHWVSVLSHIHL